MKKYTAWMLLVIATLLVVVSALLVYLMWGESSDDSPATPTTNSTQTESRSFTSAKGVKIELDKWPRDNFVSSPLVITGKVPGSWAAEGSFPIDVVFEGDISLPGTTATLKGDWMTEAMVPLPLR